MNDWNPLFEDEFDEETSSTGRTTPYLMGGLFAVVILFALVVIALVGAVLLIAGRA